MIKIKCKNCGEPMFVGYSKNDWTECFKGDCETCGWRFMLKDKEFDYIQPDSPFFEMIYKHVPGKEVEMNKKKHAWEEEQRKAKLEEKYYNQYKGTISHSVTNASEKRAIEKEVLKEN